MNNTHLKPIIQIDGFLIPKEKFSLKFSRWKLTSLLLKPRLTESNHSLDKQWLDSKNAFRITGEFNPKLPEDGSR